MSFTAADILRRCQTILNDAGGRHWPTTELIDWLNDGLREITLQSPTAVSKTVIIDLAEGTRQTLDPDYASLIRVNCNVTASGGTVTDRGKEITPIKRATLASHLPGWQNPASLPASTIVDYIIEDSDVPGEFYVVPSNDGNGQIEAVVAKRPTAIAIDATSPLDVESYTSTVDLDDMYLTALVDFVLSKAFAKDTNLAGAMERSMAHYQSFANALQIRVAAEQTYNPNRGPSRQA